MLKLIMCVKRQPHISREEFDRHWKYQHAQLVQKHMHTLGIRRYIQTTPFDNPDAQSALQKGRNSLAVNFDGCAELWWDNFEAHQAARQSPQGALALQELIADEETFVDLSQSQLWYGQERQIIPME